MSTSLRRFNALFAGSGSRSSNTLFGDGYIAGNFCAKFPGGKACIDFPCFPHARFGIDISFQPSLILTSNDSTIY
jgi:hypothetical protein